MRRLCRARCARRSHLLWTRVCQVIPENRVHISERALAPNLRLKRHRAVTSRLSSQHCASGSSGSFALSIAVAQECGHHDARLSGGPRPGQATPLRSVPDGLTGLTRTAVRRKTWQLRDGRNDVLSRAQRSISRKELRRYDSVSTEAQSAPGSTRSTTKQRRWSPRRSAERPRPHPCSPGRA